MFDIEKLAEAADSGLPSHTLFGILLPTGERLGGNHTRREVIDALVFMPHGSRIDPPIPEGNPVAMNFLDALCDSLPNELRYNRISLM